MDVRLFLPQPRAEGPSDAGTGTNPPKVCSLAAYIHYQAHQLVVQKDTSEIIQQLAFA